ncbi:MAG: HdeD family acid-resistance protein [Beutenbergiaceae bacterium]
MESVSKRSSIFLMVSGAIAVLFGLLAAVWPGRTALILVVIWAIYALVDGILSLVSAFRDGAGGGMRVLLIVAGVLGVLAGIIALVNPVGSAIVLAWVLGIWLIARGVLFIIAAFAGEEKPQWLLLLVGVLWIVVGILFTANPGEGVLAIALWIGLGAIAWGVILLVQGWRMRSASGTTA